MVESPIRLHLRTIRESHGLTHHALAEKIGVTQSYISQIESGGRTPSLPMLARIAHALHVPIRDLIDERPCPGCPYWERNPEPMAHCVPVSPALNHAREFQQTLADTLRRRTTWLGALTTSGMFVGWLAYF